MSKVAEALKAVASAGKNGLPFEEQASECKPDVELTPAPFPLHCLPPAAEAMARAVGIAVRVPPGLAGPVALGILSGCIGAGLEIESGPGRTSRANLYILASAASGSGKSEALRLLAALLHVREQNAVEAHRRDTLPGALADAELLNVEIATLKKRASKLDGDDAAERAKLRVQLQEKKASLATAEAALQDPVLTVENVTTEKLAVLLSLRGETLFSLSGDAGSIVNNLLGRYVKGERTDESLYLKAWTGEPERVDRLGRESVTLHRPCVSALWLVQPDKVESLLANPALSDGGLLPRFLLCHSGCEPQEMPDEPSTGSALPSDISAAWAELVGELLEAYCGRKGPAAIVHPTEEAIARFREHHNASVRRFHSGELRDVNSFRARWTEQGWRIALILHAGIWGVAAAEQPLTEETVGAALAIVDWFAGQQLGILAKGRGDRARKRLESLCARLTGSGGAATLRDLHKSHSFDPAEVRALAAAYPRRLRVETRAAGPKGGRPSETAFLPAPIIKLP